MNQKNILLLNWRDTLNPYAGGAEIFAKELAKRLIKDGFRVIWFCSKEKNQPTKDTVEGIDIIRKGSWMTVYLWAFFYYIFKLRKNTDIIIDCQNGIPFFSPLYSRKKVICVVHHVHREVFRRYSPNKFIKYFGIFLESLIPIIYKKSKMVAVSPSSKEALEKILRVKNNIYIIYNGTEHQRFFPGEKNETPIILYLGRLKKYKKINDLIEAFSYIKKDMPEAKCIIAGRGEEKEGLKNIVQKLDLKESVIFKDFVSEEEKIKLLQEAWVLVYPSTCEGWGISVIEANACGTTVIASDVAGLRDSVRNNTTGLLYSLSDKQELARKIKDILIDKELRKKLEQNAIEWSKKFDWNKSYEKFKELLLF